MFDEGRPVRPAAEEFGPIPVLVIGVVEARGHRAAQEGVSPSLPQAGPLPHPARDHALGRLALMQLKERGQPAERVMQALWVLDQACIRMYEGQHMDLVFQDKLETGVNSYLEMASNKTGALMSCDAELGALVATDKEEVRESFRHIGMALGVAHHIRDDILDLWGSAREGPRSDNVLSKKKSLPVVYALEQIGISKKRELGAIYFKRVLEPPDVEQILTILEESQARQHAEETAERYCQEALQRLAALDVSPSIKADLAEMAHFIVSRNY